MKAVRTLLLFFAAVATVATATSSRATAGVQGTKHDLRDRLGITDTCLPCHGPHGAMAAEGGPLWNHSPSEENFVRDGRTIPLGRSSKLCMGCHDGVTAVGAYGSMASADPLAGLGALGTNLTDDHPVGVDYPEGRRGFHDPLTTPAVQELLEDGKVECGSCHLPHTVSLRVPLTSSALCLTCHDK